MEFKVNITECIEKNMVRPDKFASRGESNIKVPFPLVIGKTILQKGMEVLDSMHLEFTPASLRILVRICDTCNGTSKKDQTSGVLLSTRDYIVFDGTNYLLTQTYDPRYTYKYFIYPQLEIQYEKPHPGAHF